MPVIKRNSHAFTILELGTLLHWEEIFGVCVVHGHADMYITHNLILSFSVLVPQLLQCEGWYICFLVHQQHKCHLCENVYTIAIVGTAVQKISMSNVMLRFI